jgi:uncharacterized protein (TIGR04255 family)
MPISIPKSPQTTYRRNFLESVICQIRVNPIFKIAKELPSEFQEAIRRDYPYAQARESIEIKIAEEAVAPPGILGRAWRFTSEDGTWTITLDARFLALDTKKYVNFEDFSSRLNKAHESYLQIYSPSPAERVGLRYINAITPPEQPKMPKDWSPWINPELLGFSATDRLTFPTEECFEVVSTPQDLGAITVRHGFNKDQNGKTVYLIDVDRYTSEKVVQSDVLRLLRGFNDDCYNLFEWASGKTTKDWMNKDG